MGKKKKAKVEPKAEVVQDVAELQENVTPLHVAAQQEAPQPNEPMEQTSPTVNVQEPPVTETKQASEEARERKENEPMSDKKYNLPWMDMNAGIEMFNQFAKPFGEAMKANMEQVQKLQEAWMTRTQEAVQQSQEMVMEGYKQSTDTVKRFYETAQEQVKRFTK